jgi:hypothetical protein
MKNPSDRTDPLLRSLLEDAKHFPSVAAELARSRRRARRNNVGVVLALAMLCMLGAFWPAKLWPGGDAKSKTVIVTEPSQAADARTKRGYVKAYAADDTIEANSIPADATERERKLMIELPGVPLLIVKNDSGHGLRVHIFDR